jgi:maltose O-acetyltransferase
VLSRIAAQDWIACSQAQKEALLVKSWMVSRQLFFAQQRVFYLLSALLPDNAVAGRLRAAVLRIFGARIGSGCNIRGGARIQESFQLVMGDEVFVNSQCFLDCSAPIKIGSRTQFGYQVTLITGGHEIGSAETRAGSHRPEPITIGEGAWIGARSTLLPGVSIGDGAVVGAGSVITRSVPAHTVVAGNPARVIRVLDTEHATEPEPLSRASIRAR